ncbi:hypothetical protein N7532_007506 [Penicillium argentinense]|uniref:Uncharacterized protein n=1 Tax=Penicillium argentinense TaxID=1131581 RepID=A0A9W9F815_9EURO|nr:uncharacterized protein N7532_007506 [Penicillium argentinense]KAJ5095215.1 hypothetical protein N7532_007506 [Penicillium argentinense]
MSSPQTNSHHYSDTAYSHTPAAHLRNDSLQSDINDSELIHHLYFEDNDSFFPPSWIGNDGDLSEHKPSTDSPLSDGFDGSKNGEPPQPSGKKEHLD